MLTFPLITFSKSNPIPYGIQVGAMKLFFSFTDVINRVFLPYIYGL